MSIEAPTFCNLASYDFIGHIGDYLPTKSTCALMLAYPQVYFLRQLTITDEVFNFFVYCGDKDPYRKASNAILKRLFYIKCIERWESMRPFEEWAARYGQYNVLKYIIDNDRRIRKQRYAYLMILAAQYGHLSIVRYFVEIGVQFNVNCLTKYDEAFAVAAANGHMNVLRYFMSLPDSCGINPSFDNNYAFRIAAANGFVIVLRYLMQISRKFVIDPAEDNNYAVCNAAMYGHLEVLQYLLELHDNKGEQFINFAANGNRPIIYAAGNGHLDVVKFLCELSEEHNVDPTAQDNRALSRAVRNGHLKVVQYLCENTDAYLASNDSLCSAAEYGHLDIVQYLLDLCHKLHSKKHGYNITCDNYSVFNSAIYNDHVKILRYFTQFEINLRQHGRTSMEIAAHHNSYKSLTFLLDNLHPRVNVLLELIQIAIDHEHLRTFRLLITSLIKSKTPMIKGHIEKIFKNVLDQNIPKMVIYLIWLGYWPRV